LLQLKRKQQALKENVNNMKKNKLGVVNSLYNNIRKKGQLNKKKGLTPKKPSKAILKQERKIKKK
jgi:hypothetical protein